MSSDNELTPHLIELVEKMERGLIYRGSSHNWEVEYTLKGKSSQNKSFIEIEQWMHLVYIGLTVPHIKIVEYEYHSLGFSWSKNYQTSIRLPICLDAISGSGGYTHMMLEGFKEYLPVKVTVKWEQQSETIQLDLKR